MRKKVLSVILSIVMSASMVMPAFAAPADVVPDFDVAVEEQTESSENVSTDESVFSTEETEASSEVVISTDDVEETESSAVETDVEEDIVIEAVTWTEEFPVKYDNDALYEGYVSSLFGGENAEIMLQAASKYDGLTANEKKVYNELKKDIADILDGKRTPTKFNIPVSTLGINNKFSSSEYGYTGGDTTAVCENIKETWDISALKVLTALVEDMPYEMYWVDYKKGSLIGGDSILVSDDGKEITFPVNSIDITLYVAQEYSLTGAEGTTVIDSEKAKVPKQSVTNAKAIISEYAGKTDLEKLEGYRDKICEYASYDATVKSGATQIINVFDGNDKTNAGSEGYAGAFQYLCDNSTFTSNKIHSYILNGLIKDDGTFENKNHTWNAVHMDNDKIYFVDVTYCDTGMVGYPDKFFLIGGETEKFNVNNIDGIQYKNIYIGDAIYKYSLRTDMLDKYSESELTISASNYFEHEISQYTNNDVKVTWDEIISNEKTNNVFTIGYKATVKCKCARCLKENPAGVDITVASGIVGILDKYVAKQPTCHENGETGVGPYIEMDFLKKGTKRKVTIPVRPIAKYTEHDFGDWTADKNIDGRMTRTCKRKGCGETEEKYTIGEEPVCVAPTGVTATYGQTLADISLVNPSTNTPGRWDWVDEKMSVGDAGTKTFYANFIPTDRNKYHPVMKIKVSVEVKKIDYTGNKSAAGSIDKLATCYTVINLPEIPAGANYGAINNPSDAKVTADIDKAKRQLKVTSKGFDSDDVIEMTIDVNGATNYKDYKISVQVTPKAHVHAINKLKFHKEVAPTKTTYGIREYYECANNCECKLDKDGKVITDEELSIDMLDITLRVDANGGEFASGENVKVYKLKYDEAMPTIDVPTWVSGDFEGWTSDGVGKTVTLGSTVKIEDDMVLFAKWNLKNCKVTFMNGDTKYDEKGILYGVSFVEKGVDFAETPTKTGYTFLGWFTGKNGTGEEFTEYTKVNSTAITVYALWGKVGMDIALDNTKYVYTGAPIKPGISSITYDGVMLIAGTDYSVSYKNNTKAYDIEGKSATDLEKYAPTVVITAKGNYSGTYKKYFSIEPKKLSDGDIAIANVDMIIANGKDYKPTPAVTWGKTKLVNNRDYEIKYYKITGEGEVEQTPNEYGNYVLRIIAKSGSNYTGSSIGTNFKIEQSGKTLISKLRITYPKSKEYAGGSGITLSDAELKVYDGSTLLAKGTDYSVGDYGNNTDVGTASVTISAGANGKFVGTKTITFQITGKPLNKAKIVGTFAASKDYDGGKEVKQSITFSATDGTPLTGCPIADYVAGDRSIDYTIEYLNNTEIGKATVIYRGVNGYTGEIKKTYNIKGENVSTVNVVDGTFFTSFTYDGKARTQYESMLKLIDKNKKELNWTTAEKYESMPEVARRTYNCIVSYNNNDKAGTANMIITGVNNYSGTKKKTFKINQYDIKSGDKITIDIGNSYEYAKSGVCPEPVVKFGGNTLVKGQDYTVAYVNNKNLSDGTGAKAPIVKITGKGNFKGVKESSPFAITPKILNNRDFKIVIADKTATGKPGNWKSTVSVVDADGKKLALNSDYSKIEFRYGKGVDTVLDGSVAGNPKIYPNEGDIVGDKHIVPAGVTINVTVYGNGKNGYYTNILTGSYRIAKTDINSIKYTINPMAYSGKEIVITNNDIIWSVPVDGFTIDKTSYKNNIKKGKATVTVIGKGDDYCGTKTITFNITSRGIK
ncbi:MAG: InlB B-repeat-containing protein [Lachnospiraceae bacterium]|nr:InlB B-repeat-containing protein [Candidatus Colinaster scatohippi]